MIFIHNFHKTILDNLYLILETISVLNDNEAHIYVGRERSDNIVSLYKAESSGCDVHAIYRYLLARYCSSDTHSRQPGTLRH